MGRFERGLAKIPSREPADAASPSPDIAASAPEDLDEYLTRRLRHHLNVACAKHGLPSSGWCGLCGDNHLPDPDCPIPLDELVSMA